jgi:hypothetical protein
MFAVSFPVGRLEEVFRRDEVELEKCRAICAVRDCDEVLMLLAGDCVRAEKIKEGRMLVGLKLGLASVN